MDLVKIYDIKHLRHSYSQITSFVIDCYKDNKTDVISTLDLNITNLYRYVVEMDVDGEYRNSVFKLTDHIRLEIIRCNYYRENVDATEDIKLRIDAACEQLKDTYKDIDFGNSFEPLKKELSEARTQLARANRLSDSIQMQMVSVLGIFAAIILAFFGGFSYFTSVFNNLHNIELTKSILLATLLGFIIFNTVAFLLVAVSHIIERPLKIASDEKNIYKSIFNRVNTYIAIIFIVTMMLSFCSNMNNYLPQGDEQKGSSPTISAQSAEP